MRTGDIKVEAKRGSSIEGVNIGDQKEMKTPTFKKSPKDNPIEVGEKILIFLLLLLVAFLSFIFCKTRDFFLTVLMALIILVVSFLLVESRRPGGWEAFWKSFREILTKVR